MTLEEILECGYGEVTQMLVIDRVELTVIDEILDIRSFDHRDAVVLQQSGNASHESVRVGHVSQNVVAVDDIGSLALCYELDGQLMSKESEQRLDPLFARRFYRSRRRVDAEHRNATRLVVLQQIAVVARQLHHEALRSQFPLIDAFLDVLLRVAQQCISERREVWVIRIEQFLGWHGLEDLHERAVGAERHVQRIARLLLSELRLGQEAVGQRQIPERQKDAQIGAAAGAAVALGRGTHAADRPAFCQLNV